MEKACAFAAGWFTRLLGAGADYALRIELEDFSQFSHAPNASRVAVRARASLVSLADRALLAQRVFTVERAAPAPDARGAVAGLAAASEIYRTAARMDRRAAPGRPPEVAAGLGYRARNLAS